MKPLENVIRDMSNRTLVMSDRLLEMSQKVDDLHELHVKGPSRISVIALFVSTIALAVACGVAL